MKKLFFVLSLFSISFVTGQDKDPDDPLVGKWINEDENTLGLTKCNISYENGTYVVEQWGSCRPNDCYLGKESTQEIEKGLTEIEVHWDHGFVVMDQSIGVKDGRLGISIASVFNDERGRTIEYYSFKKIQ